MELRHLKYFLAVAETQNIRLAAQRVHVTQPAISRKIKELETELGVQLFDRLPKGLRLNRAGKIYQKQLGAVIRQIDDANEHVRQFTHTEYGSLALGAHDFVLWEGQINQCINQFRHDNHHVELEVYSDTPMVLLKRLELDQIDGAFLYHFSDLPSDYSVHPIAQDKLVLAYPSNWGKTFSPKTNIEELNLLPSVRLPRSVDPYYYDWQEILFNEIGWSPEVTQWAHGESTMLGLVAAGNGVAIVNERHFTRASNMLCYTPLDVLPHTSPLSFVYKNTSDNPALMEFLQLLSN
ncbi:DNA-binding transcriptional LysR family regulator [Vibrio diazotrophicus]|uniref:DNA-binding transcriptional LysR family regulator n=1 Tax=Vibrio diazotrophicus TaxID=685 RepID=A0A329EC51_VIBDI|nr:LysR family transcriptional regulator [Vibrio diazotrophicus]RAS65353.1 DNA-binding transcriptional LysR family regulator [Vibrio diazotrophicus]